MAFLRQDVLAWAGDAKPAESHPSQPSRPRGRHDRSPHGGRRQKRTIRSRALRIGVLVERRYWAQTQPAGLCAALRAQGHDLILIDPEATAHSFQQLQWPDELNLLVCRGRSLSLLALLAWAEARGTPTLNRHAAIAAVHNKATMAAALAAAKLPTPETFLGTIQQLGQKIPEASFPIILKPIFGDNSRGLRLVESPSQLANLEWPEAVALAQEYHPGRGTDLKLYGIGREVWAVRRPRAFQPAPDGDPGGGAKVRESERVELTPELRALANRCRELFALELYGVDCIETPEGPLVLEVNEFPNYTGVPGADELLRDYVGKRISTEGSR